MSTQNRNRERANGDAYTRYTIDLDLVRHRRLRMTAVEHGVSAADIVRSLLDLISIYPEITEAVIAAAETGAAEAPSLDGLVTYPVPTEPHEPVGSTKLPSEMVEALTEEPQAHFNASRTYQRSMMAQHTGDGIVTLLTGPLLRRGLPTQPPTRQAGA